MKKTIDTRKLKVKYVLGNYASLKSYPTSEDILYELILDFCGRIYDELKFTDASIKRKYNLTDEELSLIIDHFKSWKLLKEVHGNNSYTTYKIIKNPFA